MASSEASESNYLDVLLKGEQIIQAVMRKSIDSEKSSTPSKRRYGLRSRAETILEATQAVLHDFSNKSDSIQDEHLNAAVKCLQLMAGAQKAGLTSFTPKFVSEFLEDQTEKVVAVLEKLDENRVLKFGLQFWTAHLQVVLTMTKHLTPEILVRACHPVAEWIKQFAFDAKTEVYKETVRLSEQIKNSDLEEDCKTATLGALEVSDMVPLNVSKRFPSPSKILAPTNFSALFKSPAQQSQSSSQPVRTTRRSSVKRPVALVDEDSVDYVPITSKNTGSARKKAKLTEHQKEKFAEKKDKLPFMDEDSQSCQNLIGVLATNFDFESSSQSASTQGQKKEEGNPGQETREKKEKNDNENGNQEIGKVVEPESAIEDNKRKTNVKLDFERESPAIADEPNLDKESDDGEEEIQKMDVDVNDVVPVTSEVAEKSGPTPTLEERLVETSLKDPETPEEENEAENTPQKFATPEKEVVTPTHSPSAAHLASKRKSRTPTRHQARPKWAIMDSVAKVKHDKKKAEIAQVLPPPVPARLTPVESPKAEKSEEKEESEKIKTEENVENAEIPEQDQDQENQSQALETKTPPRIVIEPVKPTVGTPSILKKPGTPMNSEKKKYRVHFHSPDKADVSTSDEVQGQSQETSVSTPMTLQNDENQMEIQHLDKDLESGGKKAEEDEEPIFSELIDCDQPVTSVIPRLIPHGHSRLGKIDFNFFLPPN
ncbi:hypothetical protein WR25_17029 [Diploscapter pachys]|uniref:Telomere-associated protein Rif1 N-terminal domain-containing protein n=1 Tax=Diploscapter pachys TaxID=2018661 RepID=A0A2A2KZP7_9BILA|nr:hypothetical protein WR25_17029 [Diploscapter pachys]